MCSENVTEQLLQVYDSPDRCDYSPQEMDQGVDHEKVFSHKKETCAAAALQTKSSEKAPLAAGEWIRTRRVTGEAPRNKNERLKEWK
jgi:hypothetical protein